MKNGLKGTIIIILLSFINIFKFKISKLILNLDTIYLSETQEYVGMVSIISNLINIIYIVLCMLTFFYFFIFKFKKFILHDKRIMRVYFIILLFLQNLTL